MAETFAITKLVVGDLEASKAFYGRLCGLTEAQRIEGEAEGRRMTEIIMAGESRSAATLVLITYHGQPRPAPGECVLVFETGDLDAFVARAAEAGGSVTQPPRRLPEFGLSYAFVQDPEGHTIEGLQRGVSA